MLPVRVYGQVGSRTHFSGIVVRVYGQVGLRLHLSGVVGKSVWTGMFESASFKVCW